MTFLLLWLLAAVPPADYATDNETWNGLSRFWREAASLRADIQQTRDLDWALLDPQRDALLFWSPETAVPTAKLWAFLHRGGRAAVAEDFRSGAFVFAEIGLNLVPEEEAFPVAVPMSQEHPLTKGLHRLVGNHAASFVPLPAPLWVFPDSARALVLEVPVGAGKLLLVSDPSLLINDMWMRGDNRRFARRLLAWAGDSGRRIHLLVRYTERNWPPLSEPVLTSSWQDRLSVWLNEIRRQLSGGLGWRLLGVVLLGPFFYAFLTLATRVSFPSGAPLPRLATRSELSRLWLRLMALSELLSRRMGLSSVWYATPAGRLRELAQARFGDESPRMEALLQLAFDIARTMNADGVRSVDHARLSRWVEEIEDFLRDFSTFSNHDA